LALINLDRPAEANERFREVATFSTDPDYDSENTLLAFAYRRTDPRWLGTKTHCGTGKLVVS